MLSKLLFLVIFTAAFSLLELYLLQRAFNPPASAPLATLVRVSTAVVCMPLLYPLVRFDPDGDQVPRWLQRASLPANALIWGLAALFIWSGARRWLIIRFDRDRSKEDL